MDGTVETTLIQALLDAAGHAPWSVFIGLIMLVVCSVVRHLTAKVEGELGKWLSAVIHFLAGIGTALAAGGVWWGALLLGALASSSSGGLSQLLQDAVKNLFGKKPAAS